jgi:hypothetical protein
LRCFAGGHGFSRRPRRGFLPAGGDGLLMTPSINRYGELETRVFSSAGCREDIRRGPILPCSDRDFVDGGVDGDVLSTMGNAIAMAVAAAQQAMCQLRVMMTGD